MYKQTSKMIRNVGIGLAAGAAVAAIGGTVMKNNKSGMKGMKKSAAKTASKAMANVSSVIGDVSKMLK